MQKLVLDHVSNEADFHVLKQSTRLLNKDGRVVNIMVPFKETKLSQGLQRHSLNFEKRSPDTWI